MVYDDGKRIKDEFRNLVGQEEYQRYVDINVATYYEASFSSYVTAIRFDSKNTSPRRRNKQHKTEKIG